MTLRIRTQAQANALGLKIKVPKVPTKGRGGRSPRASLTPHQILWAAVSAVYGERAELEYAGAVPGRKYRIDIAIPSARLALEIDGWEYHGKYKADFTRDRARQNLLTIHGWRILRFTAGQIRKDTNGCIESIKAALAG
ncbi:MAG: DUF559 domain-containing protein [Rhodocyclaceae bacterium]|nr:DUF559 domain-containing protein [Rhodocyclaceae bacterium]